jgi:tetratricopeptide (TPR) repeat protein
MHHFRLGHATWGAERLEALSRALELYPNFPFAHFQAAMVHIARGALALAASTLGEGQAVQRQHAGTPTRFPARGLHWLLGMIALARGDASGALEAFDVERTAAGSEVYGSEFALAASCNRGFALLKLNRRGEASAAFEACLERDGSGRAALGAAAVHAQQGDVKKLTPALSRASALSAAMRENDRLADARLIDAAIHTVRDQKDRAGTAVEQALAAAPPGPFGWMLPIDPLFASLRDTPRFRTALRTLAARAA